MAKIKKGPTKSRAERDKARVNRMLNGLSEEDLRIQKMYDKLKNKTN